MHLGGKRTRSELEKIARNVSNLLRTDVYLVLDTEERKGKRFESTSKHGKWADGLPKKK